MKKNWVSSWIFTRSKAVLVHYSLQLYNKPAGFHKQGSEERASGDQQNLIFFIS
jgi:hypothetical protein